MAQRRPTTDWTDPEEAPESFSVTCVIGEVVLGGGDAPPHVAAFELIARHDAPGTYEFPMRDGRTCAVTVEFCGEVPA